MITTRCKRFFHAAVLGWLLGGMVARAQGDRAPVSQWASVATGQTIAMQVREPKGTTTEQPLPLIIYLENLAAPRLGTDPDDAIIQDFQNQGYLVVILDYAGNAKARVPSLNLDLFALRSQVQKETFLPGRRVDPARVFIVPSGSRLKPGVIYYRDPVRTLAMDIIYPAHPVTPPGAVLEFSCDNQNRMGNTSLVICSDTILDAEATEGLAVAMADHPVKAPYKGLDAMPDCAWKTKAAVRTLRAEGTGLGMNGRIVPAGFSRGSGMALMLLTTMGMSEFEGHGENTNISSAVQGAVVMSGRFTYLDLLPGDHMVPRYNAAWGDRAGHPDVWRRAGALDYLTQATLPVFLTINCSEAPDALHQMTVLRQRLAAFGTDEVFMMDPVPRGHHVTLVPEILSAMNGYLKARLN